MERKICILGAGGVGKSAIVIRFTTDQFVQVYDPTIEESYRKQITVDGEEHLLSILDTAGQEEFSVLRDSFIRDSDGFLIVYSIDLEDSFGEVPSLVDRIGMVKECEVADTPMVIVGNKCDLKEHRAISTADAKELVSRWDNAVFFETSAKFNVNVSDAFEALTRGIVAAHARVQEKPASGPREKRRTCIVN